MPHITLAVSYIACHCAHQGNSAGRVSDSLHDGVQARCGQSPAGVDASINPMGAWLDSSRQQQHGDAPDHAAAVAGPSSQRPASANLQYSVAQRMKAAGEKPSVSTKLCQRYMQLSSDSSGWLQA